MSHIVIITSESHLFHFLDVLKRCTMFLSESYWSTYERALVELILDLSDIDGLSSAAKRALLSSNNEKCFLETFPLKKQNKKHTETTQRGCLILAS